MKELFYIYGIIFLFQRIKEVFTKTKKDPNEVLSVDMTDLQGNINKMKEQVQSSVFLFFILNIVWVWFGFFSDEYIYFILLAALAFTNIFMALGKNFKTIDRIITVSSIIRVLITLKILTLHYHQIHLI